MRRAFSLVMRKCEKMASLIKSVAVVGFWSRSWCLLRRRNKRVPGQGNGRKHRDQKANATAPTAAKADEKAYYAALKNLPNKPYDPWSGTR
jgi:hypothetical protein